jgi:hypothetical protein
MRILRQHGPAALFFVALAVAWTFPLILNLSTHLPGPSPGDNMLSLWNFWSMRTALATGTDFFYSQYQFAPVGIDLTLYTHTALSALAGATMLGPLPLVTALNVTILAALALNGFFAYLLAWRLVHDRVAAVVAGMIFACSPYLSAHLNGHFDLIGIWTIPLFAVAILEALEGSVVWGAVAGAVVGITAYVAYYYAVYQLALLVCLVVFAAWQWSIAFGRDGRSQRRLLLFVIALLVLDVLAIVVTVTTGGFDTRIGPIRLSMRDTFNQRQIFWVLAVLALWVWFRPRIAARARPAWSWTRVWPVLGALSAALLVVAAPLIWNGVKLILRGQYVTQTYVWRNAPVGIDLATLFIGQPFHSLSGLPVRRLYAQMGIDAIESGAWLGIVPVVLVVYALRRRWSDPAVRQWTAVGAVFFVWALGSHVHAGGLNTGLIMPATLIRYLPIVSNARMPGRTIVVVYLAMAVLAAVAIAHWQGRWRHATVAIAAVVVLVVVDYLAAPFPLTAMECPAIYQVLRDRPEPGSLAELPLGLGDGFGPVTPVDMRFLLCQTIHERPLVGGVTSRLPPNVVAYYKADPLISGWLRLSGMRVDAADLRPLPGRELAGERLKANGIAFVMLNLKTSSAELREYVERILPLTMIAEGGEHVLYVTSSSTRQ